MHQNYELDEQAITNIILRCTTSTKYLKQIKLVIFHTKFKMSNLIIKNNSPKSYLNQTNSDIHFGSVS